MRRLTLLLCVFFNYAASTQNVSAYLEECDSDVLLEAIECTGNKMTEYFLQDIDKDLCPGEDSPNIYSVTLKVGLHGESEALSVDASPYKQIPCIDYFKEKAAALTDLITFSPAVRKEESVISSTTFKIKYPILNDLEIEAQKPKSFLPIYNGCTDLIASKIDKTTCAKEEYLRVIYSHIRYPKAARQKRLTGTVVLKFVVNRTGNIEQIELLKDIGYGCGEEALRVMNEIAKLDQPFIPGYKDGQLSDYVMSLPINFNLGVISN